MKNVSLGIVVILCVDFCADPSLCHRNLEGATGSLSASASANSQKKQKKSERFEGQKELERFQTLIGEWRGVGQPKRNSSKGAWIESTGWIWQFKKKKATLKMTAKESKQLTSGVMEYNPKKKSYIITVTLSDGSKRKYVQVPMKKEDVDEESNRTIFNSTKDKKGKVHRLTLSILSDIRVVMKFESKRGKKGFYRQDGQIGYTRKGESIASSENSGPVCIVSGGRGTITVSYKGVNYFVCCTGCKQAFEDDPEGIIADYLKKRKDRKKK